MTATLYHAPLTCSLAARIAAAEGDVPLNIEYLNLRTKELESGGSLYDINPLGQVSTLKLSNEQIITETSTTLLWIQSQSKSNNFRIDPLTPEFYQLARWIAFCATELHKQIFRVVFYPEATDEVKDRIRDLAPLRFDVLNQHLSSQPFLLGDNFTAADAYLTWFFVLSNNAQLDSSAYKHLVDYQQRTLNRPLIRKLIESDIAKDKAMDQNIIPD
jgi:glutathione S-transferase